MLVWSKGLIKEKRSKTRPSRTAGFTILLMNQTKKVNAEAFRFFYSFQTILSGSILDIQSHFILLVLTHSETLVNYPTVTPDFLCDRKLL